LQVRFEDVPVDGTRYHCTTQTVRNIIAEVPGTIRRDEIIIVGGHYDSRGPHTSWHDHDHVLPNERGTPGANDNGSGVAATLALARRFAHAPQARTLRFYLWVNEEPPFYQTEAMGSVVSAKRSRAAGEKIIAAISFDTVGCYSRQPREKREGDYGPLPGLLGLPRSTDYVAFMGVHPSSSLMRKCAVWFNKQSQTPIRTLALPYVHHSVGWSDDWSYQRQGYPAFCVTDTAFLRADHYPEVSDTIEHVDFPIFADVVWGMQNVIAQLASAQS
jgi:hypothetical protein